ncbi:uncharacterized protein LOC133179309 [Saccostrea echinata]|uniref:uncharacterized protein LOC133179309 n=1 Tax=Saccostrea echinata TaxID=191078 RepID=UPI002A80D8B9|nr:uncharacterized protein LOC133179309 [Saccostrea echinata]
MSAAWLLITICIVSSFLPSVRTNDYSWSQGTKQYHSQLPYGNGLSVQAGNSYGKTYSGNYGNGISGTRYGYSTSPQIGIVLPKTFGYGFMGYDMHSLLGGSFYDMMGFALPQTYGLRGISYLHPQALLQMQPIYNLYGYGMYPFYNSYGGHFDVYQRYGFNNHLWGYGNGLWGGYPSQITMHGPFGPRISPFFGYKEPGFLERLGFHGISKDIVTVVGGALLFAGLMKLG